MALVLREALVALGCKEAAATPEDQRLEAPPEHQNFPLHQAPPVHKRHLVATPEAPPVHKRHLEAPPEHQNLSLPPGIAC